MTQLDEPCVSTVEESRKYNSMVHKPFGVDRETYALKLLET